MPLSFSAPRDHHLNAWQASFIERCKSQETDMTTLKMQELLWSELTKLKIKHRPKFGRPAPFMQKKLLIVLNDCAKTSFFIDDIPIIEWYTTESPHAFPVISDDGAPPKVTKEVENV